MYKFYGVIGSFIYVFASVFVFLKCYILILCIFEVE